MQKDVEAFEVPAGPWQDGTELDGLVFYTSDRVLETGELLEDELHFVDGRFQSAMCQDYCDCGWSEYRTWTRESETRLAPELSRSRACGTTSAVPSSFCRKLTFARSKLPC